MKNKSSSSVSTIDKRHRETLDKLCNNECVNQNKEQIKSNQILLDLLLSKSVKDRSRADLNSIQDLKSKIEDSKRIINNTGANDSYLNYFFKVHDIVVEYYSPVEEEEEQVVENSVSKDIMYYFMKDGGSSVNVDNSKSKLYKEYVLLADNSSNKTNQLTYKCGNCGKDKLFIQSSDMYICDRCQEVDYIVSDTHKPLTKDTPIKPSCSYRPINHFNEWLSRSQAKENTVIPDEIINQIKAELIKQRIVDIELLTPKKMVSVLHTLGLNKYYEHAMYILYKINGVKPPTFTRDQEEKLRSMFKQIQEPFKRHCPMSKRRNLLSYPFMLHNLCKLNGMDEHCKSFPLLKNRTKLAFHDNIWKLICIDNGWSCDTTSKNEWFTTS